MRLTKANDIPANSTAVNVVIKGGFWEPFRHKSKEKCSTTPLPTRDRPKDAPELAGHRKGYLTAIGMYGGAEVGARPCGSKRRSKPQGHGWVCRCDCGNYTVRRTRSLRKNAFDACLECVTLTNKRDGINIRKAERNDNK